MKVTARTFPVAPLVRQKLAEPLSDRFEHFESALDAMNQLRAFAAIRPPASVLPVPLVRQSTTYSCGAACMEAVMMYWGQEFIESEMMQAVHTTPQDGTDPQPMVDFARQNGLQAEYKENQTLEDLQLALARGVAPILNLQAWTDTPGVDWGKDWDDGHYVVLVGMDKQNLYLMDPSVLGGHAWMSKVELAERWHDEDSQHHRMQHGVIYIEGKQPQPPAPWTHTD